MIRIPFDRINNLLSRGYVEESDLDSTNDELYLDFIHNVESPFFITDFKLQSFSGSIYPSNLNYMKPFLNFQSTKSTKKTPIGYQVNQKEFDTDKWCTLWNNMLYYYLFITKSEKQSPWGILDSTEIDLEQNKIFNYYQYFSDLKESDVEMFNMQLGTYLPKDFVQLAFIKKGVSEFLLDFINQIDHKGKSNYSKFLKEKGIKWAEYLEKKSVDDLWDAILDQSKNGKKPITKETINLISLLFSVKVYLSRMDIESSFHEINKIITSSNAINPVQNDLYFEQTLIYYFSKIFESDILIKEITFLPDCFLLNYLARDYYEIYFNDNSGKKSITNPTIYKRFKENKNLQIPKYLSILGEYGKGKNLGKMNINVSTQNLNQLNHLPEYLYKNVVKDMLRTAIEIYGFTQKKLGINTEILFQEFNQMKSNQHHDLKNRFDIDKWLQEKASTIEG
jgi:hypothetical protein